MVPVSDRHVVRKLQWWGMFWRLETQSSNFVPQLSRFLCPNIGNRKNMSSLNSRRFFSTSLGDLPPPKKRKVFRQAKTYFFWSKSRQVLDQFSLPIPRRGAIFVFSAKIGLKSGENGVFFILFRPMVGIVAPFLPPPGYATEYQIRTGLVCASGNILFLAIT